MVKERIVSRQAAARIAIDAPAHPPHSIHDSNRNDYRL
jgi:hypothetical protein